MISSGVTWTPVLALDSSGNYHETTKHESFTHLLRNLVERSELEEYLRDRPHILATHLEGEEAKRRESIERAIAALKKERWRLYMSLLTPHLCDDPRPELVEVWRAEATSGMVRDVERYEVFFSEVKGARP